MKEASQQRAHASTFAFMFFNGLSRVSEDSTNMYLNENWKPVSEALKPIISKTIEDILSDIMAKIFHQIPGDYFVADLPKPNELKTINWAVQFQLRYFKLLFCYWVS